MEKKKRLRRLGKYFAFFRTAIVGVTAFKLDFIAHFLHLPLTIFVMVFFWNVIFKVGQATEMGGMGLKMFIIYIVLAQFIGMALFGRHVRKIIERDIKRGTLTNILTRPVNYIGYLFAQNSARGFLFGSIGLVLFLGVSRLLGWFVQTDPLMFLLFLVSFLMAILLNFFLFLTLSLGAFWTKANWGIVATVNQINRVLSGSLIPITVLPVWLISINAFLPFQYIHFIPVFTYIGKFTVMQVLANIAIQAIWSAIFLILSIFILKAGLKRFDSEGG